MSANQGDAGAAKGGGKMKLILMIVLPVLLLGGGGAAAFFMGLLPGSSHAAVDEHAAPAAEAEATAEHAEVEFVDLPDLLINLNVTGKRLRFLKIATSLEVAGAEQAEQVRTLTPRIVDSLHLYFRSIKPEELAGPDGVYRIKEDLLVRINDAVKPAAIRDVLVKEMLVQ